MCQMAQKKSSLLLVRHWQRLLSFFLSLEIENLGPLFLSSSAYSPFARVVLDTRRATLFCVILSPLLHSLISEKEMHHYRYISFSSSGLVLPLYFLVSRAELTISSPATTHSKARIINIIIVPNISFPPIRRKKDFEQTIIVVCTKSFKYVSIIPLLLNKWNH